MSFPRYEQYKDSGVEWLGEVPAHWNIKAIKWLSPVLRGASPRPIDDPKYFDDEGEYAWVRIADASASDGVLVETTQRLSALGSSLSVKLEPGSLFVSIAGTVGKPCVTGMKACIHDGFVYFPRLGIDQRLLYRAFEAGTCYGGLGKMGTQLNLNTDTIGSIRVAVPPSDELQQVLAFLDRETAKIDDLVAEQRNLIELLKEKRQALISHAVTKGLNPDAPMKDSGVEWLGEVPAHWNTTRLKFSTTHIIDCPHETPSYSPDGEYLVVRTADVFAGTLNLHNAYRLDQAEYENRTRRGKLLPEDVVYGREGERWGYAAIVPDEVPLCLGQRMMQFRVRKNICPRFIMWQLNADSIYRQGQVDTVGATAPHVNISTIANYILTEPPPCEQYEIAINLDVATAQVDDLMAEAETTITLLQERRTALISAAVTGKIDVRERMSVQSAAEMEVA